MNKKLIVSHLLILLMLWSNQPLCAFEQQLTNLQGKLNELHNSLITLKQSLQAIKSDLSGTPQPKKLRTLPQPSGLSLAVTEKINTLGLAGQELTTYLLNSFPTQEAQLNELDRIYAYNQLVPNIRAYIQSLNLVLTAQQMTELGKLPTEQAQKAKLDEYAHPPKPTPPPRTTKKITTPTPVTTVQPQTTISVQPGGPPPPPGGAPKLAEIKTKMPSGAQTAPMHTQASAEKMKKIEDMLAAIKTGRKLKKASTTTQTSQEIVNEPDISQLFAQFSSSQKRLDKKRTANLIIQKLETLSVNDFKAQIDSQDTNQLEILTESLVNNITNETLDRHLPFLYALCQTIASKEGRDPITYTSTLFNKILGKSQLNALITLITQNMSVDNIFSYLPMLMYAKMAYTETENIEPIDFFKIDLEQLLNQNQVNDLIDLLAKPLDANLSENKKIFLQKNLLQLASHIEQIIQKRNDQYDAYKPLLQKIYSILITPNLLDIFTIEKLDEELKSNDIPGIVLTDFDLYVLAGLENNPSLPLNVKNGINEAIKKKITPQPQVITTETQEVKELSAEDQINDILEKIRNQMNNTEDAVNVAKKRNQFSSAAQEAFQQAKTLKLDIQSSVNADLKALKELKNIHKNKAQRKELIEKLQNNLAAIKPMYTAYNQYISTTLQETSDAVISNAIERIKEIKNKLIKRLDDWKKDEILQSNKLAEHKKLGESLSQQSTDYASRTIELSNNVSQAKTIIQTTGPSKLKTIENALQQVEQCLQLVASAIGEDKETLAEQANMLLKTARDAIGGIQESPTAKIKTAQESSALAAEHGKSIFEALKGMRSAIKKEDSEEEEEDSWEEEP